MKPIYYHLLQWIKWNPEALSARQKLVTIIVALGEHPDTLNMYVDRFISPQQMEMLQKQGLNGWSITQNILANCEIKTSNSAELTYKYFGYVKVITSSFIDQLIDEVSTRIQLEKEYADVAHVYFMRDEQEEELTFGELEEFL